jgi:hypothetical protein
MDITQLPFPRHTGLKHIRLFVLTEDLFLEQWIIPAGVEVKLALSRDFGYCFIPYGTQDKRGFEIPRGIFRY